MQLVQLATDPGDLAGEVDLVAQDGSRLGVRAQRVQRRGRHAGRLLLVVEDGGRAAGDEGEEERQRAQPAPRRG